MTGHLVHVGYAKAGSTFLQNWFAAHPQLAYRKGGIAGFDSVWRMAAEAAVPQPGVRYRVTSYEGLTSPHPDAAGNRFDAEHRSRAGAAADQTRACDMLANLFPAATILIVTRGFRTVIMSAYSQYVRIGGQASLEDLFSQEDVEHYWRYDDVIQSYRRRFGSAAVIVLPYERLRDDPEAFCQDIETRLGLDHGPVSRDRVNQALSPTELRWYPRLAALANRLPFGAAERVRRAAFTNRLRIPIQALQAVHPLPPVTSSLVTDALLERFRGQADGLRQDSLYAPYADDYLF